MFAKGLVFIAAALLVAFGVVGLAHYQSSTRRTPTLTTEDVISKKSP